LVDVMIPAYGDGPLLRQAVDSVLGQDSSRWRLTVIDDYGDPPTEPGGHTGAGSVPEPLPEYLAALGDHRVRYLRNPYNLGINRNFQRCLSEADAELVVLLGADDRLRPDYVRTVLEAAERFPDVAWIHPGVRVIDADGRPALPLADRTKAVLRPQAGRGRVMGGELLTASLLRGNWMYFPSVAFRREIVQDYGFRDGFDVVLDLDLYVRMLMDGHRAVLLGHVCFEYRRHAASLSSAEALSGDRFDEELRYFAQVRARARQLGWSRAARAAGLHPTSRLHALALIPSAIKDGDRALSRRLSWHALGTTGTAGVEVRV
jgi:glycosyltransferase involved in cell wall biosynthesis